MMTMKSRLLTVVLAGLATGGCASTGGSAVWLPPPGSAVKVNQEIEAGSRSRVFIQNGRAMDRAGVSVTNPYCYFSLDRAAPAADDTFTIKPGTFTVTKSYRLRSHASASDIQYAGRAGSDRTMSTVMELGDSGQRQVDRLTCARWGMMGEEGWPTIREMQATLSPLVGIEPAG